MSFENDDTLQLFVAESLEHLADIENDFLAIEAAGADLDEELINKVYRAAHSIKGGAGFMGLANIKDLTHEMENILGKFRNGEFTPNPEIINILLRASDTLRDLINNISTSNDVDISEHVDALMAINEGSLPQKEKATASEAIDILFPDGKFGITVGGDELSRSWNEGKYIYLLEIDLIQDVHMQDKTLQSVLDEMQTCGVLLSRKLDTDAVGTLDQEDLPDRLPFVALFATILQPDDINGLFDIDEHSIFELSEDLTVIPVGLKPSEDSPGAATKDAVTEVKKDTIPAPQEPSPVLSESSAQTAGLPKQAQIQKSADVESSLRVHVSLLDSLMTLAGDPEDRPDHL
jgi:two-component system chemotaxis sensor kinase CheA